MDKISVIVPVYNVEKYLDECVKSIVDQTYKNLEIILVDDGSKDSSGKICDDWEKKDKRVKVIHQKNAGQSEARNNAIKQATGDYFAFVDSDDWIDETMYEKLLNALKSKRADISMGRAVNELPSGETQKIFEPQLENLNENNLYELYLKQNVTNSEGKIILDGLMWTACRTLFSKKAVDGAYFLKDAYGEDLFFNVLCLKNIEKIAFVDEYFYHYRMRENSSSHTHNKSGISKRITFIKEFLPLIEGKVSGESLAAFKFSYFCLMLITLSKDADKNAYKLVTKDELLKTFNNKFNYKCLMKQTTSKIKKISYFLVYRKLYKIFNFVYRRR